MTVQVVTAVPGAPWEAELVSALELVADDVVVVRRCVDLSDLLATAATGVAEAVLVSADLRRLDRDALSRLWAEGVGVVGLFSPGDDDGDRRLRQLGVREVLSADAPVEAITGAVCKAVAQRAARFQHGWSGSAGARAADAAPASEGSPPAPAAPAEPSIGGRGAPARLIAIWGPTGAPGRTTLAVNVAAELALLGRVTVLADADVYGGVVAQALGLFDEAPGLASAARMANNGTLDLDALARLTPSAGPGLQDLRILSGIPRADRWPELRPAALEHVWETARLLADFVVVDCGFSIEQDEELAYDTMAPRRNGATVTTLEDDSVGCQ